MPLASSSRSACVALMSSDRRTGFKASGVDAEAGAVQVGEALLVEIFLHAGDADVVDVDEAEHMRADAARWDRRACSRR